MLIITFDWRELVLLGVFTVLDCKTPSPLPNIWLYGLGGYDNVITVGVFWLDVGGLIIRLFLSGTIVCVPALFLPGLISILLIVPLSTNWGRVL